MSYLGDSFQKYHPNKILPFISCLNKNPPQIGNSLSYTLHCAERARIADYTTIVQPCAQSEEGEQLLAGCADRCDALNTHTSATIRIAKRNVCIRDDGAWRDCKEVMSLGGGDVAIGLQKFIEKEWKRQNSKGVLALSNFPYLMIGILANGEIVVGTLLA